ncbi:CAP-Gly domain-containing protein [Caerostris extrusa]|uniref:CAP-Gly domain-containing protein n=1 Tax=Caerostris extrusa TaxID=172846 RepID=A0AAV4Y253_CAEEX|nr:CAP-Gly domain-containing protein [Caerostris extrusa]
MHHTAPTFLRLSPRIVHAPPWSAMPSGLSPIERVHPEHGVCDGSIKGKRYFQCASNNAIFVGINRLRLHLRGYKYTQSGNIVEHGDHREREGRFQH